MNRALKIYIAKFSLYSGFFKFLEYISKCSHIIFTFHRVRKANTPANNFDTCPNVDVDIFRNILKFFKTNYNVTTLNELCENLASKKKLAAITFDDVWRDNFELAYPILKEMDLPATMFVNTGKINSCVPFWQQRLGDCFRNYYEDSNENNVREFKKKLGIKKNEMLSANIYHKVVEKLKTFSSVEIEERLLSVVKNKQKKIRLFLSEKEIYEMSKNRIDFGSHTVNHVILTQEKAGTITKELYESKMALEKIVGKNIDMISYPNGNYSDKIIKTAKSLGYKYGFTLSRNCIKENDRLMALTRFECDWDNLKDSSGKFNKYMFQWEIRLK